MTRKPRAAGGTWHKLISSQSKWNFLLEGSKVANYAGALDYQIVLHCSRSNQDKRETVMAKHNQWCGRENVGISHSNNAQLMQNYLGCLNVLTSRIQCKNVVLPERETYKHTQNTDDLYHWRAILIALETGTQLTKADSCWRTSVLFTLTALVLEGRWALSFRKRGLTFTPASWSAAAQQWYQGKSWILISLGCTQRNMAFVAATWRIFFLTTIYIFCIQPHIDSNSYLWE